jgi:hypothetical protein
MDDNASGLLKRRITKDKIAQETMWLFGELLN